MERLLTTTEFGEAIGASQSSMRRWTNSGLIQTARTAGGHRRIALSEAIRFVRESGTLVLRPELLGMPALPTTQDGKTLGNRSLERQFYEFLRTGNAAAAKGCITGLFLGGMTVAAICDGAIRNAMQQIGELWLDDPREILTEHRATDICIHALGILRQMLSGPAKDAPVALGAAPQGDPYLLSSLMAGAVLAEAGYRDVNFGPDTPLELLAAAAEEQKARIVWLSVKSVSHAPTLRTRINELAERLRKLKVHLVIGGTAVESLALRSSKNTHIMQTMSELAAFARGAAGETPPIVDGPVPA